MRYKRVNLRAQLDGQVLSFKLMMRVDIQRGCELTRTEPSLPCRC